MSFYFLKICQPWILCTNIVRNKNYVSNQISSRNFIFREKKGGWVAISCHHLIVVELCVIYSHNNKMDLVNYICIKQLFFIYLPMEQSSDGSLHPAQRLMGEIKCMKTRCSLGTVVNSQVPDRNKEAHYEIRNYDTTKGGCCWWRECLEVLPLSKVEMVEWKVEEAGGVDISTIRNCANKASWERLRDERRWACVRAMQRGAEKLQ